MGSRAVVIVCRDETVSVKRFGVIEGALGVVYTRTGRPFFQDQNLERQLLQRVQAAAEVAGLWQELETDWLCLDCELMPWSMKAQELLRLQYAPTGTAGVHALAEAVDSLTQASGRLEEIQSLADHTSLRRLHALEKYRIAYRHYCWTVNSIADLKLAPFHLLANEGQVHIDKPHTWHMETLARLSTADPEVLLATPFRQVDLNDTTSCDAATTWWSELTSVK